MSKIGSGLSWSAHEAKAMHSSGLSSAKAGTEGSKSRGTTARSMADSGGRAGVVRAAPVDGKLSAFIRAFFAI